MNLISVQTLLCWSDLTHFPLVAGVFLGGFDKVAAAAEVFVVLIQRHVSVLHQHVWQMRLWSDRGERKL